MGGKDLIIDTMLTQWGSVPQYLWGEKRNIEALQSHLMEVVTGQVHSVWKGNGCV